MSTFINVNVDLQGILDRLKDQQQAQRQAQLEKEKNQTFEEQVAEATRQFEQQQLRSFAATPANRRQGRPLRQDELAAFRNNRCPLFNNGFTSNGYRIVFEPRGTIPTNPAEQVELRFCRRYFKYRFLNTTTMTYGPEIELWDGAGTGDPNDPSSTVGPPGSEPFAAGVYTNPFFNYGYNLYGSIFVSDISYWLSGYAEYWTQFPPTSQRAFEPQIVVNSSTGNSIQQIGPYALGFGVYPIFSSIQDYTLQPRGEVSQEKAKYAITSYDPIIIEFRPVNPSAVVTKATCYFGSNPLTIPT